MYFILPFLALASVQSTYGPVLPPEPVAAKPADLVLTDTERMLRAQGVSEIGIRALRSVPMPQIVRGATMAAQCAVEKLAEAEPIPLADLASAMEERDATAAAQAQAQTRYVVAALHLLGADDRRVFLKVVGSGELPIGRRPRAPKRAGAAEQAPSAAMWVAVVRAGAGSGAACRVVALVPPDAAVLRRHLQAARLRRLGLRPLSGRVKTGVNRRRR